MQLKQFIKTKYATISPDATYKEALEKMVAEKTNGLVVMDSDGKPVGTIDSFHLIHNMMPTYLEEDPMLARFEPDDVVHRSIQKVWDRKVKEMMQCIDGVQIHEDDSFIYAAALASKHGIRYLPVMDSEEKKLLGVISRTQIKRGIAKMLGIQDS